MARPDRTGTPLPPWSAVSEHADWQALLLGNGASLAIWPGFAYTSLFDEAKQAGVLGPAELALFERCGTANFEAVLAELGTAMHVLSALGQDTRGLARCHQRVQTALGAAIRRRHVTRPDVPDAALATLRTTMDAHRVVFTTNYDLLVYWAMGHQERYGRLADLFWTDGPHGRCQFELANATVWPGWTPLYYLHGALHLVAHGDGATHKLTRTPHDTILEQFDRPAPGDAQARPLLVTEGTATEKLRSIDANAYLRHALAQLRDCTLPLVVYGSALSSHDHHLLDAINTHPDRPVAVSMLSTHTPRARLTHQAEIRARLHTTQLHFFAAHTHPLGQCRADRRPSPRDVPAPAAA